MYADLHIHTTHTEGSDDPLKILNLATQHGINTIAITDHNSVEGVKEARKHTNNYDINLIDAVDLITTYQNKDIHILGYHIDIDSPTLHSYFKEERHARVINTQLNFSKAVRAGDIDYDWDRVVELSSDKEEISGINVVYAMNHDKYTAIKYPSNWAFYRDYFSHKGKKFVQTECKTPFDAIHVIKKCGGIPVIAHPKEVGDDRIVKRFLAYGLLGIEVYHPSHHEEDNDRYLKMAREHNLFITGGTGWFGKDSPKSKSAFGEHGLKHDEYGILRVEGKKIV